MRKMFVFSTGFWGAGIAIVFLLFLLLFPLSGLIFVYLCKNVGAFCFFLMSLFVFFIIILYIKQFAKHLFSLYIFDEEKIMVKGLFFKQYSLYYEKMSSIEIASYVHGVLNSSLGSKYHYICFSYDKFDSKYRNQINYWRSNERCIKVEYSPKLRAFLLDVLPSRQCNKFLVSMKQSNLK